MLVDLNQNSFVNIFKHYYKIYFSIKKVTMLNDITHKNVNILIYLIKYLPTTIIGLFLMKRFTVGRKY